MFGGTFDPIHLGHLAAARAAKEALGLDGVLVVVANDPWKKWGREVASAQDRLAMVETSLKGAGEMVACDIEIERGGTSYTADTLEELRAFFPDARLFLIVGADVLAEMETWERSEEIGKLASVAVVTRPGSSLDAGALRRWSATVVEAATPDISSSELRERILGGDLPDDALPAGAREVIVRRGLYRNTKQGTLSDGEAVQGIRPARS